jgi:alpha-galactosidase
MTGSSKEQSHKPWIGYANLATHMLRLTRREDASAAGNRCRHLLAILPVVLLIFAWATAIPSVAAAQRQGKLLAATPPMGWNDWAHYQCGFTAQTILDNATALVKTGLAARGYNTVTIDDCWMLKDRDAQGNLQVDPQRFPRGMKPVADAIHGMGLKFGIYEDAGYLTCGKYAGSGEANGGGKDYFLQDTRLFASWGVDYLKLDGCNVYVPDGVSKIEAYRKAYAGQSAALKSAGRPIVFSESAPAYFQDTPDWYDVLAWVPDYGELWREGTDIATFHTNNPDNPRFSSVLWNYAYNLPLDRYQKPGHWNDADFIIGGDGGMSVPESRSQLALWAMMSAPLILSSDLTKLSPEAIGILSNKAILAVDQDPLGKTATLVRRTPVMDVLFKKLSGGDYAVAALNRGSSPLQLSLSAADLGFSADTGCRLDAQNLWDEKHSPSLQADIASHDTVIWRIHAGSSCHTPSRTGDVIMVVPKTRQPGQHGPRKRPDINEYSRCLAASGNAAGSVGACMGAPAETWTVTSGGALKSAAGCLAIANGQPVLQACGSSRAQHWNYNRAGNLLDASGQCLTATGPDDQTRSLSLQACGHNQPNQLWSLPN